jgi:hypothetical protein
MMAMAEEKKGEAPAAPPEYKCYECGEDGFCEQRGKKPENGPCEIYPDKTTKWVEEQPKKRGGSRK